MNNRMAGDNRITALYERLSSYRLTGGYKWELLPSEDTDIKQMGEALAGRCEEN